MQLEEWIQLVQNGDMTPDMGAKVQLYQHNGKWFIRAAPSTIEEPTPAQRSHRERFAKVMSEVKGSEMRGELPPGAALIRKRLSKPYTEPPRRLRKVDLIIADFLHKQEIEMKVEELVKRIEVMQ